MYNYGVGDRVWARAEWDAEQEKIGHVKKILEEGKAVILFAQWSELLFKPDGFSYAGLYRITRHVTKQELDLTRRI